MFAMANAVKMVKGDVATLESRLYEVATGLKITLPYEVQEKSVRINGFEEAAEAAEGKFSVVITTTGEGAPNTVITFAENDVAVGDTLRVFVKVVEGNRERLQAFEGTVIARRNGSCRETFTVRRVSYGIGVERTFPLHSPRVDHIEIIRKGKVRRAKLYYLRGLQGKAAKIKEAGRE